jgi:NET1-associated nuclear protein 1 (U3 small nucleolar RNA-associated protein 17)
MLLTVSRYIIVANRTAIHVYSTSNSLLTRTIKLKVDTGDGSAQIITYTLSPTHPNILWVACSDGKIFSIDWTSGAGTEDYWTISSTGCTNMTVASMESAGRRRDVVFTTEPKKDGGFRITANELTGAGSPIKTAARTIYTSSQRIQILKTVKEGSVIVGASENRILIGRIRSTEYDTVDKIRYEFRVFQSADAIKSLDARITERRDTPDLRKSSLKMAPVVDLVVGDVRGVIFLHNDLLAKLFLQSLDGKTPGINLVPRKLHWHRQAVHAVKWSLDGM